MPLTAVLSHPHVARIARALAERPGATAEVYAGARHAAVALILRVSDGGALEALFIKRAVYEGDPWSGHVALPGGRSEPGDESLEATAVRETREEIGVDLARDGQILGTLDELSPRTPVLPPIIIRPFVAVARGDVAITPSPEIAYAFWLPVRELLDPAASGEATIVVRGVERRERCFRFGEHIIWGLTDRILRQFVRLLE